MIMDKRIRSIILLAVMSLVVYLAYNFVANMGKEDASHAQQVADEQLTEITNRVDETTDHLQSLSLTGAPLYTFRTQELLQSHYEKHGRSMGFTSAEEYEIAAYNVIANPDSLHKTEAEDGDDVYYLEATNEFVVLSTDGYIRTYFCPSDGKAYFDRQ